MYYSVYINIINIDQNNKTTNLSYPKTDIDKTTTRFRIHIELISNVRIQIAKWEASTIVRAIVGDDAYIGHHM